MERNFGWGLVLTIATILHFGPVSAQTKQWTTASKPGDGSRFTWRGHAIGDTWTIVLDKEEMTEQNCVLSDINSSILTCIKAGSETIQFFFNESTKKLVAFQYIFMHHEAEGLYRLLIERYGKPSQAKTLVFQTNAGAKFDTLIATWNTPAGLLVFNERNRRADVGNIEINMNATRRAAAKPF